MPPSLSLSPLLAHSLRLFFPPRCRWESTLIERYERRTNLVGRRTARKNEIGGDGASRLRHRKEYKKDKSSKKRDSRFVRPDRRRIDYDNRCVYRVCRLFRLDVHLSLLFPAALVTRDTSQKENPPSLKRRDEETATGFIGL